MRKLVCFTFDAQSALVNLSGFCLSELELRVIRNAKAAGFIPPCQLEFNCSSSLLYIFEGYSSFWGSIHSISKNDWKSCVLDLFKCIDVVESNGFLNLCNLSLEPECVLYNSSENKLGLFYLPVDGDYFYSSVSEFSNSLRLFLRRSCEEIGILDSNLKSILADSSSDISRMKKAIEDCRFINSNESGDSSRINHLFSGFGFKKSSEVKKKGKSSSSPVIRVQGGATEILDESVGVALVYKGDDHILRLEIKSDKCVIGKQKESVDQVIPFSKAVSRVHCKAGFNNGQAYISDLGSSNGTYVNGRRLEKDEVAMINAGDLVKIANLEFVVEDIKL